MQPPDKDTPLAARWRRALRASLDPARAAALSGDAVFWDSPHLVLRAAAPLGAAAEPLPPPPTDVEVAAILIAQERAVTAARCAYTAATDGQDRWVHSVPCGGPDADLADPQDGWAVETVRRLKAKRVKTPGELKQLHDARNQLLETCLTPEQALELQRTSGQLLAAALRLAADVPDLLCGEGPDGEARRPAQAVQADIYRLESRQDGEAAMDKLAYTTALRALRLLLAESKYVRAVAQGARAAAGGPPPPLPPLELMRTFGLGGVEWRPPPSRGVRWQATFRVDQGLQRAVGLCMNAIQHGAHLLGEGVPHPELCTVLRAICDILVRLRQRGVLLSMYPGSRDIAALLKPDSAAPLAPDELMRTLGGYMDVLGQPISQAPPLRYLRAGNPTSLAVVQRLLPELRATAMPAELPPELSLWSHVAGCLQRCSAGRRLVLDAGWELGADVPPCAEACAGGQAPAGSTAVDVALSIVAPLGGPADGAREACNRAAPDRLKPVCDDAALVAKVHRRLRAGGGLSPTDYLAAVRAELRGPEKGCDAALVGCLGGVDDQVDPACLADALRQPACSKRRGRVGSADLCAALAGPGPLQKLLHARMGCQLSKLTPGEWELISAGAEELMQRYRSLLEQGLPDVDRWLEPLLDKLDATAEFVMQKVWKPALQRGGLEPDKLRKMHAVLLRKSLGWADRQWEELHRPAEPAAVEYRFWLLAAVREDLAGDEHTRDEVASMLALAKQYAAPDCPLHREMLRICTGGAGQELSGDRRFDTSSGGAELLGMAAWLEAQLTGPDRGRLTPVLNAAVREWANPPRADAAKDAQATVSATLAHAAAGVDVERGGHPATRLLRYIRAVYGVNRAVYDLQYKRTDLLTQANADADQEEAPAAEANRTTLAALYDYVPSRTAIPGYSRLTGLFASQYSDGQAAALLKGPPSVGGKWPVLSAHSLGVLKSFGVHRYSALRDARLVSQAAASPPEPPLVAWTAARPRLAKTIATRPNYEDAYRARVTPPQPS